jgi:four helix bundle protein
MDRKILEKRLVAFSTDVLKFCRTCKFDAFSHHLLKQIVRSSSSTALNYGEAQSAESRADFAHKLSIVLKELRETYMNLILIDQAGIGVEKEAIIRLLSENNELIAIFQKSVNTLRQGKNLQNL